MRRKATLLFLVLAFPVTASAEESSLARLLPPDTPIFFEMRGPTADELERLPAYRMMQQLFSSSTTEGGTFTAFEAPVGPLQLGLKIDIKTLDMDFVMKGPWATESVRMRPELAFAFLGPSTRPENRSFPVDLVAAFRVHGAADAALPKLQRLCAAVVMEARGVRFERVNRTVRRIFQAVEYRGLRYVKGQIGIVPLRMAAVGDLVILATDDARIRSILDHQLDRRPSLATSPRQRSATALSGKGTRTFVATIHFDHLLRALKPVLPVGDEEIQQILKVTGFDSLRTLSMVARISGPGMQSRSSLMMEGPRRGLARLFGPGKPNSRDALKFLPKSTLYCTSGAFEPAHIFQALSEAHSIPGHRIQAMVKRHLGLDLHDDLLKTMGPEACIAVASNRGLLPDVGLLIKLRDPVRFSKSLDKILESVPWPAGAEPKKAELAGVKARVIPMAHPRLGEGIPLAPTFGIVDGWLVVTPFPISFQRFVEVRRGKRPSIEQNRDFAALIKRVPEEAQAVSYMDMARVVSFLQDTVLPLAQSWGMLGGPASPLGDAFDGAAMEPILFGRVGWRINDEDGAHWHAFGAADFNQALLIGGLAGAGIFVSHIGKDPHAVQLGGSTATASDMEIRRPKRISEERLCRKNVLRIRNMLRGYLVLHKRLPDKLEDLPGFPEDCRECPGGDGSYVYLGTKGAGGVLLHGHPNGPDKRISVLVRTKMKRGPGMRLLRLTKEQLKARLEERPQKATTGPGRGGK